MVNTPFPCNLRSESKKAAKILKEFSIPSAKTGPDKIIPVGILVKAAGLAILTVAKIGFLVTARAGSGIVIARLSDGRWSAPSAIGIAGLGGGFELGAEMTDFVIILNSQNAINAFSKGGNLTLGGNFTIAAGPLGRNVEGDIAVRSPAAIYTYSKTRGLFAGISVEGSALIERKDANGKFYGRDIRAAEILDGQVDPPGDCAELYDVLARHQDNLDGMLMQEAKRQATKQGSSAMDRFRGMRSQGNKGNSSGSSSKDSYEEKSYEGSVKRSYSSQSLQGKSKSKENYYYKETVTTSMKKSRSTTVMHTKSDQPKSSVLKDTVSAWDKVVIAKAVYPFEAQMGCDLSFSVGDEIEVITRTETQNDWWEGQLKGQIGIFPANYTRVI